VIDHLSFLTGLITPRRHFWQMMVIRGVSHNTPSIRYLCHHFLLSRGHITPLIVYLPFSTQKTTSQLAPLVSCCGGWASISIIILESAIDQSSWLITVTHYLWIGSYSKKAAVGRVASISVYEAIVLLYPSRYHWPLPPCRPSPLCGRRHMLMLHVIRRLKDKMCGMRRLKDKMLGMRRFYVLTNRYLRAYATCPPMWLLGYIRPIVR